MSASTSFCNITITKQSEYFKTLGELKIVQKGHELFSERMRFKEMVCDAVFSEDELKGFNTKFKLTVGSPDALEGQTDAINGLYLGNDEFIHSGVTELPMVMISNIQNGKYNFQAARRIDPLMIETYRMNFR